MVFIVFFAMLYTWEGLEVFDAIGVSVSAIGNVGPAFGIAGATQNFAALPDFTKFALCFEMLMGRLEIFTFIALLRPAFWRRRSGW
jgi:trk system potassium uptake protein TrkH